jgi:hypothetical protein
LSCGLDQFRTRAHRQILGSSISYICHCRHRHSTTIRAPPMQVSCVLHPVVMRDSAPRNQGVEPGEQRM